MLRLLKFDPKGTTIPAVFQTAAPSLLELTISLARDSST
jgi:hypothetical protein